MQTVLITGTNRGIGLALTKKFLSEGWKVIAACRDPDKANDLKALSGEIEVHALDVTDEFSVRTFAETIKGRTVDVLLNNAGIMGGERQSALDMDFDAWNETLKVNTIAPLRMGQAMLDNLRLSKNPRVVTISSMMGSLSRNTSGFYAYRSSKAAVNMVMKTLAGDLAAEKITVIVMHPGWVQTDMGGAGAEISPTESAKGIYNVVAGLKLKDSGRFLQWNGQDHPW